MSRGERAGGCVLGGAGPHGLDGAEAAPEAPGARARGRGQRLGSLPRGGGQGAREGRGPWRGREGSVAHVSGCSAPCRPAWLGGGVPTYEPGGQGAAPTLLPLSLPRSELSSELVFVTVLPAASPLPGPHPPRASTRSGLQVEASGAHLLGRPTCGSGCGERVGAGTPGLRCCGRPKGRRLTQPGTCRQGGEAALVRAAPPGPRPQQLMRLRPACPCGLGNWSQRREGPGAAGTGLRNHHLGFHSWSVIVLGARLP